ncbi:alpha/beta fold hydrolase [Dysosmobacter sp.]|uniref:alpha/beta fold hydrolase n=1 Tax=Dysosmobacter sp. TaxID=2591382 RepID=UPI002A97BD17|nr:alpha/beta fold hydrolase [Dysosmobacter sp.]MCI6054229.1 alpha/beta hydrolase [Dysosmobacter sp.]MDY5511264.1 alpha/beta fold hydrolase [Dysosmobacter sp.]
MLAKHRRILVDLLGAGYSGSPPEFDYSVPAHAAYLKEFVDGLGVRDVVLFGHSLGGPVAIELAKLCGTACALWSSARPIWIPAGRAAAAIRSHSCPRRNLPGAEWMR